MTEAGCKVCRVLERRGLTYLESDLLARWRGEDGKRMGYRRLADWLNAALLREAMGTAGLPTAGGEARSRYERLTGDDDAVAAAVADLLADGGVDVDALRSDFVSYGVVRTHLLDCLDASRPASEPSDWERAAVDRARRRAAGDAADALRSLVNKGGVAAGGDPEVTVSMQATCPACGASRPVEAVLDDGHLCDCDD
jgi:hypothetical protein